jgi:hypothetical protein
MKGIIKYIDIYGLKFNFTNFGNETYKTAVGGFFSVLTYVFLLVLIIIFGKPFFNNLDPNVIVQLLDQSFYPTMNPNFDNFPIAFRFENEQRGPANIGKTLYPFLQYVSMKRNNDGYMSVNSTKILNYTSCNKDIIKDPSVLQQLQNWSCVDWRGENYTLGGTWDAYSQFAFYFKLTIFYCQFDGINYSNCTDYNTLNNLLNAKSKIYLSMYIPSVSTVPSDYMKPLKPATSNIFFTLSPLLMRTDRYYYQTVEVEQDVGWFSESLKSFTGFSMEKRDTDLQIRTVDDYNDTGKIKTIATAVFVLNNKLQKISVNFSKIQTFAANVGGVLKIIMEFFRLLLYFLNSSMIYHDIVNKLSSYESFKNKMGKKPDEASLVSVHITHPKFNTSIFQNKKVEKKNQVLNQDYRSQEKIMGAIKYSNVNKSLLCCISDDNNSKLFKIKKIKIKEKLDIINYIRLASSYDIITKIILNKDQNTCLKFLSNGIEYFEPNSAFGDFNENEKLEVHKYLSTQITSQGEIDKKLIDKCHEIIKLI